MPVAVELQDHVDQMLQCPRPGDRAVLGDVADENGGQRPLLRYRHQRGGDLPDLSDAAGSAFDACRGDGLHRVDDQQAGPDNVDMFQHGG